MTSLKGPKLPPDEEIQEAVMRDYGWQFEGPFYTEAPEPREEYVRRRMDEVERLRKHLLTTVIIRDQFDQDHAARRVFLRETNLAEFVHRKSKLIGNNLAGSACDMERIMTALKRSYPDVYQSLEQIYTPEAIAPVLPRNYNVMILDEKVKAARDLDEVIYEFLKTLA